MISVLWGVWTEFRMPLSPEISLFSFGEGSEYRMQCPNLGILNISASFPIYFYVVF